MYIRAVAFNIAVFYHVLMHICSDHTIGLSIRFNIFFFEMFQAGVIRTIIRTGYCHHTRFKIDVIRGTYF